MYIPVSHTNRQTIKNMICVVMNRLVGMALKGLVTNYGEGGGATKQEGGSREV